MPTFVKPFHVTDVILGAFHATAKTRHTCNWYIWEDFSRCWYNLGGPLHATDRTRYTQNTSDLLSVFLAGYSIQILPILQFQQYFPRPPFQPVFKFGQSGLLSAAVHWCTWFRELFPIHEKTIILLSQPHSILADFPAVFSSNLSCLIFVMKQLTNTNTKLWKLITFE